MSLCNFDGQVELRSTKVIAINVEGLPFSVAFIRPAADT